MNIEKIEEALYRLDQLADGMFNVNNSYRNKDLEEDKKLFSEALAELNSDTVEKSCETCEWETKYREDGSNPCSNCLAGRELLRNWKQKNE